MISVLVPTKCRQEAISNAVRSLFAGTYTDFEIFVVDQSDDDTTESALTAEFGDDPRFHYLRNTRPGVGAANSRNQGIVRSRGDLIAIIDDDVTAQPDYLAQIAREFDADPDLDFICGKLTAPPFDWRDGYTPHFDADPALLKTKYRMPIDAAGANFSMRRRLFFRIGGYDEFCGPGSRLGASDDGDLSWRIVRSGAKWKPCPHIEVVHTFGFRPSTNGASLLKRYQIGVGGNFGRFTRRGDYFAALYFAQWQLRDLAIGAFRLACGRKDSGLGWVRDRIIGFGRGLKLTPHEGFVSGATLERENAAFLAGAEPISHP